MDLHLHHVVPTDEERDAIDTLLGPPDSMWDGGGALRGNGQHDRVMYISPEDLILKKLWFYNMGQSDKHLRDIASMLKVSRERIDRAYIAEWAPKLSVKDIWDEVSKRVP